jgi:hypothetical protein
MKRVLSAAAVLLSISCTSFWGSVSAAPLETSSNTLLLAQYDARSQSNDSRPDLRQRMDPRSNDRRDDRSSDDYLSRTSKGIGKEGLTECKGEFAYCGASTCKPTGKKIKVKEDGGKTTKEYEEAACKCPIITKKMAFQNGVPLHGVAAVNEGNMNGSCKPPSKDTIWSYAELELQVWPQESANFESKQMVTQVCPAGTQAVNCWNYLCKIDPKPAANGVKTATCFCPIGEGYLGHPAGGNESFATAAGAYFSSPSSACSMYPVSGPIPSQ